MKKNLRESAPAVRNSASGAPGAGNCTTGLAFRRASGGFFTAGGAAGLALLSARDFAALVSGRGRRSPRLQALGFYRHFLDLDLESAAYADAFFLRWRGPSVHIAAVTGDCGQNCRYCAAGSPRPGRMRADTAARIAAMAFSCGEGPVMLEFQGGEPFLNFPAMRAAAGGASALSRRTGRPVNFSVVTNLNRLSPEHLAWLKDNRVAVCTSLDGPADIHDRNRTMPGGGSSHALLEKNLARLRRAGAGRGGWDAPNAVCTVTRASLGRASEIVGEFVRLGFSRVQLGPLEPLGRAAARYDELAPSPEEFASFYLEAMESILRLNRRGLVLNEKGAMPFVKRFYAGAGARYRNLDLVRRLSYAPDGGIYGSDEARLLAASGDDFFRLGTVGRDTFARLLEGPVARALLLCGLNPLTQHECSRCPYSSWCSVGPVFSYASQGGLWGNMITSRRCRAFKLVHDGLVRLAAEPANEKIFRRWAELPG
ncbi:MAG: radical SAM protein [Elusimicrobiales bacterium]|nr:radical SAM protein [Elusimicrobiales bacterium]